MTVVVKGRVVSGRNQRPIYSAVVELSLAGNEASLKTRRVITNRFGQFSFRIKDSQLSSAQGAPRVHFRVLDERGHEIGALGAAIAKAKASDLTISIGKDRLKGAGLPTQPGELALIPKEVFETIRRAVTKVSPPGATQAHLKAVEAFFSALPPLLTEPGFVDVASSALRGRSRDVQVFKTLLADLESWNHHAYRYDRRQLNPQEAEDLLKTANPLNRVPAIPHKTGLGVISSRAALVMVTAATRAAAGNPVRINRNIGTILEPLCGADRLASLYNAALSATTGGFEEGRMLLGQLRMSGGFGDQPPPDGPQFPPGRFPPGGFPCPDGPPWPPHHDEPPRPLPFDDTDCPEAAEAFRRILERQRQYTITGISPEGACPGDIITITGTGFLFWGSTGTVIFPGSGSTLVPSDPPLGWSDTEIVVVIPEGACDGELQLVMPPGVADILVCDAMVSLFTASTSPAVPFVGGETHIESFTSSVPPDRCLPPGGVVRLDWRVCNTDRIRLTVTDAAGEFSEVSFFEGDVSGVSYTVPDDFAENKSLTLELRISGPCGSDSAFLHISVRKRPLDPATADPFAPGFFVNFLGDIRRDDILIATPRTLSQLRDAIEFAETINARVGVAGGGCSFNDFIVPRATTDRMINTDRLNATKIPDDDEIRGLDGVPGDVLRPEDDPRHMGRDVPAATTPRSSSRILSEALRPDIDDPGHSIMSRDILDAYHRPDPASETTVVVPILRDRLVQVEAGIRFRRLVCFLEQFRLTMPALGGGTRHSVAGAISTGTHGSTTRLPPPADFVRAIHLVGTGGEQWWLEPASKRITDPDAMRALQRAGRLDPCLKVRYDDNLFYAALISFGTAGVFYSVIIETINSHRLAVDTRRLAWSEAQGILRTRLLDPATPSDWHFEITTNPSGQAWLTTMNLTTDRDPDHESRPEPISFLHELTSFIIGLPFRLLLRTPLYILRVTLRTFNPFEAARIIAATFALMRDLGRLVGSLERLGDGESAAVVLPNILNLLWRVSYELGAGSDIVDELQNLIAGRELPVGHFVAPSHLALTREDPCPATLEEPAPRDFSDMDAATRLFRSSEYAVPAEDSIDFVNAIMAVADEFRTGSEALVLQINIRFTRATKALLGMQQFDLTCHVELFTIKDLNGNRAFERRLGSVLERFEAVPHWGQKHSPSTDFASRFGTRPGSRRTNLEVWQESIDRLASASETHPNTFRHAFALGRGLLTDL